MYRPLAAVLTLSLAACSGTVPELPRVSLKDAAPTVARETPDVRTLDISLAPPVVVGGTNADNQRLATILEHALADAGYHIKREAPYRITGHVANNRVTWSITGPEGLRGTVSQSTLSTPSLHAIVPGVRSHLPKPSTPI